MSQLSVPRSDLLIVLILLFTPGVASSELNTKPSGADVTTPAIEKESGYFELDSRFFDFGQLVEGDVVKHAFLFKNTGPGNVKLVNISSSCGCTTTNDAVLREYAPGESGELEVVVDTRDKKGIIVKTVTLTLENNNVPSIELSLAMQLQPPPHPKIGTMRNINTEAACKTCHLESAAGQSGVYLYHRVCSQCHGKKGAGGSGRALNDAQWQQVDDVYIQQVILNGMPEQGMPSFVTGVTPALTDEQVSSLIDYIRGLVKQ
ncbi:MAG: DUF1573 domain-containing protein [Gammaproteobacteria bacterium]|nr:DUF1573 domain-containing protein [Gammaproteobacteria bacterium]